MHLECHHTGYFAVTWKLLVSTHSWSPTLQTPAAMRTFFFFFYISLCSLMCCLQHRFHLTDHKIQQVVRHKPLQVMGFRAPRCLSHVVDDGAPSHSALSNNYSHPVIWSALSIIPGASSWCCMGAWCRVQVWVTPKAILLILLSIISIWQLLKSIRNLVQVFFFTLKVTSDLD